MADSWLVMCDVDGVQAWLLRSVHLREIAGASRLLVAYDERLRDMAKDGKDGEVLFASGGTALVRFQDEESARKFCREVPRILAQATVNASVTVSDPKAVGASGFGATIATLVEDLERKKRLGHALGEPVDFCHAVRCQGCSLEPAVAEGRVRIGNEDRLLGAACLARHSARDPEGWLKWMRSRDGWSDVRPAADVNELAGSGKLALVLADVNGVGDRLAELDSEAAYRRFSLGLAGALRGALVEAIAREVPPARWKDGKLPIEVLYAGGDDLLIACRGDLAMPLVASLATEFANRAGKDKAWTGGKPLGLSFGITIAGSKFPFRIGHGIAAGLLRHAKRTARAKGWVEGGVDWAIVTEAWGSADAILADRSVETSSASLFLTGRPYRVSGGGRRSLEAFRRACEEVASGFPRNKLFDLRRWCSRSELEREGARRPSEAKKRLDVSLQQFDVRVRRDPEVEKSWRGACELLELDPSGFWTSEKIWRTPVGDLADGLELWGLR